MQRSTWRKSVVQQHLPFWGSLRDIACAPAKSICATVARLTCPTLPINALVSILLGPGSSLYPAARAELSWPFGNSASSAESLGHFTEFAPVSILPGSRLCPAARTELPWPFGVPSSRCQPGGRPSMAADPGATSLAATQLTARPAPLTSMQLAATAYAVIDAVARLPLPSISAAMLEPPAAGNMPPATSANASRSPAGPGAQTGRQHPPGPEPGWGGVRFERAAARSPAGRPRANTLSRARAGPRPAAEDGIPWSLPSRRRTGLRHGYAMAPVRTAEWLSLALCGHHSESRVAQLPSCGCGTAAAPYRRIGAVPLNRRPAP